jgi:hypothetical protein
MENHDGYQHAVDIFPMQKENSTPFHWDEKLDEVNR